MEDLDALLAELESSTSSLARRDPPGDPQKHPQRDPQRDPPTPHGPGRGGDPEQLYSSVQKPRPAPPPPGLGELERLLRDLNVTQGSLTDEFVAQLPPQEVGEGKEMLDEAPTPPSTSGTPPGPPPGPSSATQELDRLMASLADFKINPPALEAPGGSKPPEFDPQNPPKCARCDRPVVGAVVTALGRTWHPRHFCCAHCGDPLGDEGFVERGGLPFCRRDFGELFGGRCRGCPSPILGGFVAALGGLWHPECFVCQDCLTPFPGGSFFELGGLPLCRRHFQARSEGSGGPGGIPGGPEGVPGPPPSCGGCGNPVRGLTLSALGRRFHPEHFECSFCRRPLAPGGSFQEQGGKAFCPPCFRRLFG